MANQTATNFFWFYFSSIFQWKKPETTFTVAGGNPWPCYCMAECMSVQDEVNLLFSLAFWVGKMRPSCLLGISPVGTERYGSLFSHINNKSFIDQDCLVEMAGYWPTSFFLAFLLTSNLPGSIEMQKRAWLILCYLDLSLGLSKTNMYRQKAS